ncbi:MAG: GTPase HflX, partial [Oscillospiraceae bacterium]|nr:GTPase HflX [Oscillospiraceae bacterium]
MTENTQTQTKVMLVSVDIGEYDTERSVNELCELCETAGASVEAIVTQKRPSYDGATCIGSGRLAEMAEQCEALEIEQVIFDCELTATQIRNIAEVLGIHTIDRT